MGLFGQMRFLADITSLWRDPEATLPSLTENTEEPSSFQKANKVDADGAAKALKHINIAECLGEEARKIKRNLVIYSASAILISMYGLKLTKLPWFELQFSQDISTLLGLVLFVLIAYGMVSYLLYAGSDVMAWRRKAEGSYLSSVYQYLYRLDLSFKQLADTVALVAPKNAMISHEAEEILNQAMIEAKGTLDYISGFQARLRDETRLKVIIVYFWELLLPICLALFGIKATSNLAWEALRPVF